MPLHPKWTQNSTTAPFRDNSDGLITAATLRQFATEVSTDVAADDWAQYVPGPENLSAPYTWGDPSVSQILWLPGGGTGSVTANFSYGTNGSGEGYLRYTAGLGALLQVTLSGGGVMVSGVTAGTTFTPVMHAGDHDAPVPTTIGPPVEVEASPALIGISGSGSTRIPPSGASVMVGLLISPPAGSPIEDGTINLDLSSLSMLVIARPTAVATPIVS